uniref:Uncharacterized protein n=1 Tax=Tanacetum cinerariifolium TaxID=118510 RepID=A0A699H9U2_TANCI|nr:hypothetical protein [Tanacetum cinerariifolium]
MSPLDSTDHATKVFYKAKRLRLASIWSPFDSTDHATKGTDTIKKDKIQEKPDKTEHKTESVENSTVRSQQKVKPDKVEAK